MSHFSVLSAPLPSIIRTSEHDHETALIISQDPYNKPTLAVPDSYLQASHSRLNRIDPKQNAIKSLPVSPVNSSFPERPAFRRAATSTAASSVGTSESTRFDDLHYSQTHFSRSTFLVYPHTESRACEGAGTEEDIRELLIASSSDEESSSSPSTPGFEHTKIPPRGSSVSLVHNKRSLDSKKSTFSLPKPITLLAPPAATRQDSSPSRHNGLVSIPIATPFVDHSVTVQFTYVTVRFSPVLHLVQEMSQSSTELAGETPRASLSSNHRDNGSIRSAASSSSSSKRRSRILMKLNPFSQESTNHGSAEQHQRFGTFPRVRAKEHDEASYTLAARFSELKPDLLSPPLSASSMKSTFSSVHGGGAAPSTPATSPELGNCQLPPGRKSGSYGQRLKAASSRESIRTLFSSSSCQSLRSKARLQEGESEWEKTLEDAASRASWQSSINHRPRQHKRAASANQSTWPRVISNPVHQRDSLMLEHVFIEMGDDSLHSTYAETSYVGVPSPYSGGNLDKESKPSHAAVHNFGSLPRARPRWPSTTGTSVRGEPAMFQLKSQNTSGRPVIGTASLGRASTLRRLNVPDAITIWQMGRRRSSVLLNQAEGSGAFSVGGASRMPTIQQGHSRDTSLADSNDGDRGEDENDHDVVFPLPVSSGFARQDSLASDSSGDFIPLRFIPWRRDSQDDLALLRRGTSANPSPAETNAAAAPVFNLHPFQVMPQRPGMVRSFSTPDVPETVTSASETEDNDLPGLGADGWCRRRSTFSNALEPTTPTAR